MADLEENPALLGELTGDLQSHGDIRFAQTAGYMTERIQLKDRIQSGHMLDDGPFSRRTGDLEWELGMEGEDYFVYQNDGTDPFIVFREVQDGSVHAWTNSGVQAGNFVEDAIDQLLEEGF